MTKKIILINEETQETVTVPFLHETRKALGFRTDEENVWIPRSQGYQINLMTKKANDIIVAQKIEFEQVYTIMVLNNWIWNLKQISFKA